MYFGVLQYSASTVYTVPCCYITKNKQTNKLTKSTFVCALTADHNPEDIEERSSQL